MKILKTIALILILANAVSVKAQLFQIGHTQITYTDPARSGRSIQTEIYYPANAAGTDVTAATGNFPVIVFGHGFVMAWDAYQNIWEDLVPKGYILAFPRTEGSFSPNHGEFGKDLAFLTQKLQAESASNSSSIFYNHVSSRSAIMGHSMGGGSSFLAAENNTNITTMISLAAANTTPSSIDAAKHVTVPTLVFSGENDCVAPAVQHQTPMYDSLLSACKTFINIKGGAHCEFANYNFNCSFGQSTCSPSPAISGAEQKDVVSDLLNFWLTYYLKDDCNAITYLNDSLSTSMRITSNQSCPDYMNPVISQTGSILQSTSAATYQWYLNGIAISGATAQTYTTSTSGNYYVEVTYSTACPLVSNIISVTATGIAAGEYIGNINVFPNPSQDQVSVSIESDTDKLVQIHFLDLLGNCVLQKELKVISGAKTSWQLNVENLSKGVYFIQFQSGVFVHTQKIVKE